MNTKNNRRKQETLRHIQRAALEFLQSKELDQLTVSAICKEAGINRSTFYAHYSDVYDLADELRKKLESDVRDIYASERGELINSHDYLKLFRHISENQLFYKIFFKLGYDQGCIEMFDYDRNLAEERFNNQHIAYHMEFFRSGLNAMIKKWLDSGCQESPEEMNQILTSEYRAGISQ